ncbi:hypothetical protein [Nonomuraea sp. NPDC052265]|uniref:hypothetical protein n=1 Tax=Nonomuraea sp. NPDC052265 TaxID=3364374 RepID=UPI0037CB44F6
MARSTADDSAGRLVSVPADDPDGARTVSPVSCTRSYASGGTGLCLRLDPGLTAICPPPGTATWCSATSTATACGP